MSDPFNESKFECRAKEVYKWGNSTLWDVFVNGAKEGFREGSAVQSQRIESVLDEVEKALEKIADPRKRDHKEPDAYTEMGCVMNIANEALVLLRGLRGKNEKA